ncbi:MAG: response regulator [Anaerolineales bacterium]|nr:response regulator [Anaerolineales bacterium]
MNNPRVLLIEDDKTMLTLLQTLLSFEGFEALLPKNDDSLEAMLSFIQQEKPALVLCDVHLRQLNGFDLLRLIKGSPDLAEVQVLMSSGMDFRENCVQEGADGFILKPYMPDELIDKIRLMIGDQPNN